CSRADFVDRLGERLDGLPVRVREATRFPLGRFRGVPFGVALHAGGSALVYVEGQVRREALLSREHQGPRAVWNALERLASGYGAELQTAVRDLEVAQNQLKDHQGRLGRPFVHADYVARLAELRDELKQALSQAEETGPSAGELSDRILALKS